METGLLAHAAKESLAAGRLDDSVAYVERLVAKLVPLGKLVDEQMHVHGGRQRSRAGILAADATDAALAACGAFPDSSEWPREGPTDVPDDRAVRRWFSLMKRVGEVRTCARGVPLPPCRCARTGMPARAAAGPGSVVCPPCVPVYVLVDKAVLVVWWGVGRRWSAVGGVPLPPGCASVSRSWACRRGLMSYAPPHHASYTFVCAWAWLRCGCSQVTQSCTPDDAQAIAAAAVPARVKHPRKRPVQWTPQEDEVLLKAMAELGPCTPPCASVPVPVCVCVCCPLARVLSPSPSLSDYVCVCRSAHCTPVRPPF